VTNLRSSCDDKVKFVSDISQDFLKRLCLVVCRSDGTEHIFNLRGVGETPLALEHMTVRAKCRQQTKRTVVVPNFSPHSITYRVFSDIPFLEGNNKVSVVKVKP